MVLQKYSWRRHFLNEFPWHKKQIYYNKGQKKRIQIKNVNVILGCTWEQKCMSIEFGHNDTWPNCVEVCLFRTRIMHRAGLDVTGTCFYHVVNARPCTGSVSVVSLCIHKCNHHRENSGVLGLLMQLTILWWWLFEH